MFMNNKSLNKIIKQIFIKNNYNFKKKSLQKQKINS